MGAAEGVVHIYLRQRGQLPAEGGVVLGFLGAEASILQHQNIAVLHIGGHTAGIFAHDGIVIRKQHGAAHQLRQAGGDRRHGKGGIGALRLAQVGAEDHPGSMVGQVTDGRDSPQNPVIVGDLTVLQRHVKIHPHQYAAALYVQIFHGYFVQKRHLAPFFLSKCAAVQCSNLFRFYFTLLRPVMQAICEKINLF